MWRVDVVVVSYNSEGHLRACVEPLAEVPELNLVVVDSASSDSTLETVADLDVETIPLAENRGFAHACNVGWRAGSAPFVLFLNPDTRLDGQSVIALTEAVRLRPEAGAAAPRIVADDGSIEFSLRRFPRLRSTYSQALFLHRFFRTAEWSDEDVRDPRAYEEPWSPEWVSGACVLVRRALLEQLGGLDEAYFLYCEDIDLCRRIRDAGFEIRFEPAALVVHHGGGSASRTMLLPLLARSRARYARKHRSSLVALLERLGVAAGALTHVAVARGGVERRRAHARAFLAALGGSVTLPTGEKLEGVPLL